ncbi:MAG TPA: nicotinate (nicotinamide) nucleotide adenylyltransferase [Rhizomicrobium sp.]
MRWLAPPGPAADGLRIGLLGGSFNPAHDGHLYVSETALKRLKLDFVWWLVSPGNPLKDKAAMGDFRARLRSAEQVAAHHPRIRVSALEETLHTVYTVDTVTALRRRFPGIDFVWLMGSDNLEQFGRWRRWRDIARLVPIAVVQRPGSILAAYNAPLIRHFGMVRDPHGPIRPPRVLVLDGARNTQSATRLRAQGLGHSL